MFNNFVYQNPVKILFGKGQIAQLSKQIPADAKIFAHLWRWKYFPKWCL
jgi:alcohol dehydrogenase YqhD (iron-dependent ADH family)